MEEMNEKTESQVTQPGAATGFEGPFEGPTQMPEPKAPTPEPPAKAPTAEPPAKAKKTVWPDTFRHQS